MLRYRGSVVRALHESPELRFEGLLLGRTIQRPQFVVDGDPDFPLHQVDDVRGTDVAILEAAPCNAIEHVLLQLLRPVKRVWHVRLPRTEGLLNWLPDIALSGFDQWYVPLARRRFIREYVSHRPKPICEAYLCFGYRLGRHLRPPRSGSIPAPWEP